MSGTRQSGNRKQGASPKRNTSKKSQTNTKKTAVKQENDLGAEIRLVVLLIVSILLFFSNYKLRSVRFKTVVDFYDNQQGLIRCYCWRFLFCCLSAILGLAAK